ncbi:MAG: hypothetical protein WA009_11185 [Phototrophicaceae bacterium]|nr:hypothetical protein [Anaerolineae bacterium]
MSDDWTLRTLLGNFADLTPLADGWYTDPNWDPDGMAVAYSGQPPFGSGTLFPPSGAGLYVQRVATNGAPVGQPTTVATIAIPGPENRMRPDWNGTPVCTGARDADGDLCQPVPTATISFATNTPLGPTTTPTPSLSLTVAPTLSDAQLATIFPLPMNPTPGTPEARLSNLDFADRAYDTLLPTTQITLTPVCSRDLNPKDVSGGNHNLIASAVAEVWLVDPSGDNQGLGNFTVLRIRLQDLPIPVRQRLYGSVQNDDIKYLISRAGSTDDNLGWLYMGYAHQNSVGTGLVPGPLQYPTVIPWGSIGESGKTGLTGETEHLDISVYYVSGPIELASGTLDALAPENNVFGWPNNHNHYFGVYKSSGFRFGIVELIDPLVLWPYLAEGVPGAIDTQCP